MAEVNYTPEQRACIECLYGPVDVSAGAGSGKTFTLTQRIAYALTNPESGIDDIEEICAITFTKKAAAELKGRVRTTLRAQGLFGQALKVDGAWISTIHGMCSRVLRESALEVGLDPQFEVLEDKQRNDFLTEALNEVIGQDSEIIDSAYNTNPLLREYAVQSGGFGSSVAGMIESLINKASELRHGFDDFERFSGKVSASDLARQMLSLYEDILPVYASKKGKTAEKEQARCAEAIEKLHDFLQEEHNIKEFMQLLNTLPVLGKLTKNEETGLYQVEHGRLAEKAALICGEELLDQLMRLARKVEERFSARKRSAGYLDNNDLIKLTLEALEIPTVKARYEHKFRLVMIDEFQDTDQLQIAIIRHLAGAGLRYLCTVGDAQQSIYRFRGADVNSYFSFRTGLSSPEIAEAGGREQRLQLTRNFRSHKDILAFVRKICSQPSVFGSNFLDLQAVYTGEKYKGQTPRVRMVATLLPSGRKRSGEQDAARAERARQVAAYFAEMKEAGHTASDMVLLLGAMTHAGVYAQALRDVGLNCVVAGGSGFYDFPEVALVNNTLQALVNPEDTEALFQVLTGELFRLSADDLLILATAHSNIHGINVNRKLHKGFAAVAHKAFENANPDAPESEAVAPTPALSHAVELIKDAQSALRFESVAEVLTHFILNTGWLRRLDEQGPEGASTIANVMKALRVIADIEREKSFGPARVAREFSHLFGVTKDKPGVLNTKDQDAVRIMTVHASKGLEFPLVAVAEMPEGSSRASKLTLETVEGRTFVSLMPGRESVPEKGETQKAIGKATGAEDFEVEVSAHVLAITPDPVRYASLLNQSHREEEDAEVQRLFYVAVTRAKESVALFMNIKPSASDSLAAYKGMTEDIRSAFFGEEEFPEGVTLLDFGGETPAELRVVAVDLEQGEAEDSAHVSDGSDEMLENLPEEAAQKPDKSLNNAETSIKMPEFVVYRPLPLEVVARQTPLFSYSSLAHSKEKEIVHKDQMSNLVNQETVEVADAAEIVETAETVEALETDETLEPGRASVDDFDKATVFGSAFHRLGQLAAMVSPEFAQKSLDNIVRTYKVRDRERLVKAFERWLNSNVCERALSYQKHNPEVPFSVVVEGKGVLEGEIDLLCTNDNASAFVVDYKTGGSPKETEEVLQVKHLLQAQCYAYAILKKGFTSVEFAFVRVEQDDPNGRDSLQTVSYQFDSSDLQLLFESISAVQS